VAPTRLQLRVAQVALLVRLALLFVLELVWVIRGHRLSTPGVVAAVQSFLAVPAGLGCV